MQRRIIAIDESGALFDPEKRFMIVVSNVSYDMSDLRRKNLGPKRRGAYRLTHTVGDFLYLALYPKMVEQTKRMYGEPETAAEISLNGSYYEFMLRKDAAVKLLEAHNFNPVYDVAVIDSFCKPKMLSELIADTWRRVHNVDVPKNTVRCEHGADMLYRPVRIADENALRLVDRWTHDDYNGDDSRHESRMVEFTIGDVARLNLNRHERREMKEFLGTCEWPTASPATA